MATKSSSSVLQILQTSWQFLWNQPVLAWIAFWLYVIPFTLIEALRRLMDPSDPLGTTPVRSAMQEIDPHSIVFVLLIFGLIFISFWGHTCLLLIGKRLIQQKAGRARTSFRTVRKEALPMVLPLLLTAVLRLCITLEWSLLFIAPAFLILIQPTCRVEIVSVVTAIQQGTAINTVPHCVLLLLLLTPLLLPAIVYTLRTSLFDSAFITEDLRFRKALRRSSKVMYGHFWHAMKLIIGACLCIGIPAMILTSVIYDTIEAAAPQLGLTADIITSGIDTLASMLIVLSMIQIFGHLRKHPVLHLK
jgi:hypothetical protein